ncbi:MAG: phosphodiester glycosidase family protein [Caldilineales bacterium]|nr:phosphodiester glycosidase family protein [Caldilineales bacterium]
MKHFWHVLRILIVLSVIILALGGAVALAQGEDPPDPPLSLAEPVMVPLPFATMTTEAGVDADAFPMNSGLVEDFVHIDAPDGPIISAEPRSLPLSDTTSTQSDLSTDIEMQGPVIDHRSEIEVTDFGVPTDAHPIGVPLGANGSSTSEETMQEAGDALSPTDSSVTVTSARTGDGSSNTKTSFNGGETIRYLGVVTNTTGATRNAAFRWSLSGPCGSVTLWSGNLDTPAGPAEWYLQGSTPSNCPGNYTYTLSVTYNGQTTSRSATFSIAGSDSGSGIDYHTRSGVHVFKIDMQNSKLSFEMVMAGDKTSVNYGKPSASPREYVRDMVARAPYSSRNPILAFNADYFGDNSNGTGHHGPQGLTVKNGSRFDGKYADPPEPDRDGNEWKVSSLSISRTKAVRMGKLTACNGSAGGCYDWWPNDTYYNTVGGGPLFIENGARIGGSNQNSTQPCRNEQPNGDWDWYCNTSIKWTAAGVTQDGRYLIIVVSDITKTMDQIAEVLIAESAWRAIKLDGGRSTQVWYKNANPRSIIGGGRPVANSLMVFSQ